MKPRPFMFDLSFDGSSDDLPDGGHEHAGQSPESEEAASAAAEVLAAELATAREESFADGHAAGAAQARAETAAATAQALAAIVDRLGLLLGDADAAERERAREAAVLALTVARRMVPVLARAAGFAEIEAVVTDCLRRAIDEPRIVLRVADGEFETARERIEPLAREAGFPGRVIVLAEAELPPGDCRVEWADGGAERDSARLWREVEAALSRSLAAIDASSTQGPRNGTAPEHETTSTTGAA